MFSKIQLHNFKAFEHLEIDLKPLTFILGPNNSGKSSLISTIRLLSQTIDSYDSNVPLILNGIFGDFGTYKDIVFNNFRAKKLGIGLSLMPDPNGQNRTTKSINIDLNFKYRAGRREIILKDSELSNSDGSLVRTQYSPDSERQVIHTIGDQTLDQGFKSSISKWLRVQHFLPTRIPIFVMKGQRDERLIQNQLESVARKINVCSNELYYALKSVEYVGAMRVPPSRTFLYSGEMREKVGANGQFASNLMMMDTAKGGKKSKNIISEIKNWLNESGLASDLRIESISDRHYEIQIQHSVTKEYENFADVGYGLSQVLPILIAGYNLSRRSSFLVEQPEIHLHPKAQANLGDFFLRIHKNGVQSIVETHSEHLILRIQKLVIEGKIDPDDLVFYYMYAKEGMKKYTRLELDESGKFVQEWPEGFFPERLQEATEIAKLRFKSSSQG